MNIKFLNLGLGFALLAATVVHAEETLNKKTLFDRILGSIAQSSPMNKLNLFLASYENLDGEPATLEFQKMGAEAQTTVGISTERQVLIREVQDLPGGAASAGYGAINLDKDTFNGTGGDSYGFLRCALHHEAVHIKYNDYASQISMALGGMLIAPLAVKLLKPRGGLKVLYPIAMLIGFLSGRLLNVNYNKYYERRADIEGHYATQCSTCVQEKADEKRSILERMHELLKLLQNDEYMKERIASGLDTQVDREYKINYFKDFINPNKGYLSPDELDRIALDLKKQNKLCAFHSAQAANNN